MALVTITATVGLTCDYLFLPQAILSLTGGGISLPSAVTGYLFDGASLSVQLDSAYAWDVRMTFRGAPPIAFDGFQPGPSGGDLFQLLSAQGFTP